MSVEHKGDSVPTPERKDSESEFFVVKIGHSEDLFPLVVNINTPTPISTFISEEREKLREKVSENYPDYEIILKLDVLDRHVSSPIRLFLNEKGEVEDYSIDQFNNDTQAEWFQFIDKNREFAALAYEDPDLYKDTAQHFEILHFHSKAIKSTSYEEAIKRLKDFRNYIDDKYPEDFDEKLFKYFSQIRDYFE